MNSSIDLLKKNFKSSSYAVIILGDENSGKSTFISKYISENLSVKNNPTSGVDYKQHHHYHKASDKNLVMELWDTSGNRRYNPIILS